MHTVYSNIKVPGMLIQLVMPRFRMSEIERNTVLFEIEVQTR